MRPAEKPADPKRDSDGSIRLALDSMANHVFKRRCRLSSCLGSITRSVLGLAVKFLSGTLGLIHNTLNFALSVASSATKALFDLCAHCLGSAGYTMFVHRMLLW